MGHLQHECHPMYAIQDSVATGQFRHQESVIDTHKPWQQGTQVCFKDRTALLQQRQQLRQREVFGQWGRLARVIAAFVSTACSTAAPASSSDILTLFFKRAISAP